MRLVDFLPEGGWTTTATQGTVLKPAVVAVALKQVEKFIRDFNAWRPDEKPKIKMGHPTGSSAYHEVDAEEDPDKIYGDIDLQIIAPAITPRKSLTSYAGEWNRLTDQFIQDQRPDYLYVNAGHTDNGHPIFHIGSDQYVQVDFMWHPPVLAQWGRYRATPERGLKGALLGNLYSTLGDLLGLSIQYGGVQIKLQDGQPVSFSKQKNATIKTISADVEKFVLDILVWIYRLQGNTGNPKIDPLLKKNPGVKTDKIQAQDLVNAIRGLAKSFELNDMYGGQLLTDISDEQDFIDKFLQRYTDKNMAAIQASKFDKATTTDAIQRAADTKAKLQIGMEKVKSMFTV
jgi:hypothetical protein